MKLLFIQGDPFYRLGTMALAAFLHQHGGHDSTVRIMQLNRSELDQIRALSPDLIGFYVTSPDAAWVLRVASSLKNVTSAPIVVGGPHPTFSPEFVRHKDIDFAIRGEAEYGMLELIQHLHGDMIREDIRNCAVQKDDGSTEIHECAPLIQDLDELPFPRWQIYQNYAATRQYYRYAYPIVVGRGCPGTCSFCCMNELRAMYKGKGRFIRLRSPEHVIAELESVKRDFSAECFMFEDDSFLLNKRWLESFSELYCRKINRPFTCQAMASLITPRSADILKKMHCRTVRIGLETGNQQLRRDALRKHITDQQLLRAASLLKERGIKVQTYNMFGIPGETIEHTLETYTLNKSMKTDFAWSSQLRPFPGTELMQSMSQHDTSETWESGEHIKNYFTASPTFPLRREAENMQQFIQLFLSLNLDPQLVRRLIRLPWLRFFYPLFSVIYALSVRKINAIPLLPFIRMALAARQYMHEE